MLPLLTLYNLHGLGYVLLDERFATLELVGTALIIAGIVIVNSRPGRRVAAPEAGPA